MEGFSFFLAYNMDKIRCDACESCMEHLDGVVNFVLLRSLLDENQDS